MGKFKKKIKKKTRTPKNFSREKQFPEGWTAPLEEIPEVFFQNSEDKKNTLQTGIPLIFQDKKV